MLKLPSQFGASRSASEAAFDLLGDEILAEKADSLGRAWKKAEAALLQLRRFEETADPGQASHVDERSALLKSTAQAVHAYFIQRELCGLRRHDDVIREYRIPRAVLVRMGAR